MGGCGDRDTGISLTWITFQVTHATDDDTSHERDYVVGILRLGGAIGEVTFHRSGEQVGTGRVNHYTTDGGIAFAKLVAAV